MKEKLSLCCVHVYRNPNQFTHILNFGKICKEDSGNTYLCDNCYRRIDSLEPHEPIMNIIDPEEMLTICEHCAKEKFKNIVASIKI